ncbi:unnamed protein product [Arabidopsis arenosa]|uniref:RNase H type-1 domain-containing protein n=1 Tax=Arabidopsis arenosa TaxID=38785 RepID=A0A8S2AFS3_ARAAE|nr:unnamed protein product [Arabidopsis arenosa]
MCNIYMEEEGTLAREEDGLKPETYDLYFKGLVRKDSLAGFGVAICRQEDDTLLFRMKGSIHDSVITVLEAELTALKRGLTEAVTGRCAPEQENTALLMDDVQRIRQQLTSSIPVLMTENQANFAYKLALETLVSEISIRMPPNNTGSMRCCNVSCRSNLSCNDCKRLDTNPTAMWLQCKKCPDMIRLSSEYDFSATCRCGYSFCCTCGAEWKLRGETGSSAGREVIPTVSTTSSGVYRRSIEEKPAATCLQLKPVPAIPCNLRVAQLLKGNPHPQL